MSGVLLKEKTLKETKLTRLEESEQVKDYSNPYRLNCLQSGINKQETRQAEAFYFDCQRKEAKSKAEGPKSNNAQGFALSTVSQASDDLKDVKDYPAYLKGVKNLLKLSFPLDLIFLIFEYLRDDEIGLTKLLRYVVEGDQEKAEALLKEMKGLPLKKGTVTDLSNRTFTDITAFQYAVWALDWHMCQMLLNYMTEEEAALQLKELEEKGTAHEKHFSLEPLVYALKSCTEQALFRDDSRWREQWRSIGKQQAQLPVHVINEYCHPSRAFYPCPKFEEEVLKRSRQIDAGDCYTFEWQGKKRKLGEDFGILRYNSKMARAVIRDSLLIFTLDFKTEGYRDAEALQNLQRVRLLQLEKLKVYLRLRKESASISRLQNTEKSYCLLM